MDCGSLLLAILFLICCSLASSLLVFPGQSFGKNILGIDMWIFNLMLCDMCCIVQNGDGLASCIRSVLVSNRGSAGVKPDFVSKSVNPTLFHDYMLSFVMPTRQGNGGYRHGEG